MRVFMMDNGSNSQAGGPMMRQSHLGYSAPPDNSTPQCISASPSDSLILHSGVAAPGGQGNSQNSVQL